MGRGMSARGGKGHVGGQLSLPIAPALGDLIPEPWQFPVQVILLFVTEIHHTKGGSCDRTGQQGDFCSAVLSSPQLVRSRLRRVQPS